MLRNWRKIDKSWPRQLRIKWQKQNLAKRTVGRKILLQTKMQTKRLT